ncbi:MAG: hypothetical protein ACJ76D_04440 [Solirubrobacterales bacterium]
MVDGVGAALAPIGHILANIWPPVVAVIATVVLLRWLRNALLFWRGRSSRVQVSNFAWASSDPAHQEAGWVTSLFREQLAALRLDALDPLPDRAPGAPLVEIVEGVSQGVGRDIGAAAGRLYKAIVPDSAYEVWGSLRPRDEKGGRISIQLIERRHGNRTLLNVALDQATWEEGAREAAMAVAGALYPRVRRKDRGAWALWKKNVPRRLVKAYHDALDYEATNRLEYALASFHKALDQDPLNPNLRLKIAMLQERLELDLDAWVTYEAIVDESNPRAWRGPNRRVYLLALYRLAILLTNRRTAAQWVKGDDTPAGTGDRRGDERHARREELRLVLKRNPLFESHRVQLPQKLPEHFKWTVHSLISRAPSTFLIRVLRRIDAEAGAKSALEPFGRPGIAKAEREQRLEAALQILGLRRLEELENALRIWIPRRGTLREAWIRRPSLRHAFRPEFSLAAVKTSKLLVRIRVATSLEKRLEHCPRGSDAAVNRLGWFKEIRAGHRKLVKRWPFPAPWWRRPRRWLAFWRPLANHRDDAWQLHYNAACTAATVFGEDSPVQRYAKEEKSGIWRGELEEADPSPGVNLNPLPERIGIEQIARTAIEELEEYAYRAGSSRVAAQADWVAFDDPDLRGLRGKPIFRLWASHHLPRAFSPGTPARKADVKRFTVRVMREGSCLFAVTWRERAAMPRPPAGEIVDWWQAEAEIWKALGRACREHLSWEERLTWLRSLRERLDVRTREGGIDFSHEARAVADSMSEGLLPALASLAGTSANGTGSRQVLVWVSGRTKHVRDAHEAGEERADGYGALLEEQERAEALRAARLWTRLAELLEEELSGDCKGETNEALGKRMARVREELV